MVAIKDLVSFAIEYTDPPTEGRRWARNGQVNVVTSTVERAIEVFREHNTEATLHVVRRVSSKRMTLLDDDALSGTTLLDEVEAK